MKEREGEGMREVKGSEGDRILGVKGRKGEG